MMESIEKLREWSHMYDEWILTTNIHGFHAGENYGDSIRKMIDAIEREVDEKYMLLPLDADSVPIHVGDELETAHGGKLIVEYVGEYEVRVYRDGEHYRISQDEYAYTCHHANPRTVEDVLRDVIMRCIGHSPEYWDVPIAEYADELRELMEVDK